MPLPAGTRLGRYEVRSLLGAGGMGEVYLAWDSELERQVALKILPAEIASPPQRMSRFVGEARAASALNHPNILAVYDVGQSDATRYIVTEYVEGETLRRHMAGKPLDLREALDVAAQVASALSEAHRAGIVHRDVKPENVMVRRGGIVKVLDFGLAKLAQRRQPIADTEAPTRPLMNTSPGTVIGTVTYMSPEQARGLQVDERTDIWSLGVVLYEMVAGRAPFAGQSAADVLATILHREPPPLRLRRQGVPPELERIVEKALTKDREERYQGVKDMALDLKRLRQRLELEAELERSVTPSGGGRGGTETDRGLATQTGRPASAATGGAGHAHTASSTGYVYTQIKRHRRAALTLLAALALGGAAVAYFAYSRYAVEGGGVRSVAVLPFQNAGGDPETEYLSDGISEALINALSQLPQLKVIARSSSFKFKGREADPQEVGRALGVQTVVTGRVVRVGDRLQVSAEVVDARSNRQVWGEQYSRRASDLLAVQADISREIADRLRLRLTANEQQRLAGRETLNPEAYELRLRGKYYDDKSGTENQKKANEYYRQAVAADPTYALAFADLAGSYRRLAHNSLVDPKEYLPKAREAVRRALELDEGLAEAHSVLGYLHREAWEWEAAEREYRRAIELSPNLAATHLGYSTYLSQMGRHDEAIAAAGRARELSPLDLFTNANVGFRLFFARRYDEAVASYKKTLELEPGFDFAHTLLGYTYEAKGMYREAIAEYEEVIGLGGQSTSVQVYLGAALALAGEREKAQEILRGLEATKEYVSPGELAVLYVALGERERALASLERAYAEHDLQLQTLKVDPSFDPLRSDPRFQDLVRRVGLPQ